MQRRMDGVTDQSQSGRPMNAGRRAVRAAAAALGIVVVLAALVAFGTTDTVAAQSRQNDIALPVTAVTTTGVSFEGTFHVRRFSARNDQVFAVGTLDGTFPGVGVIEDEPVRVTVRRIEASCNPAFFRLVLGPVDVDVSSIDTPRGDPNPMQMDEMHLGVTEGEDDPLLRAILCGATNVLQMTAGSGTLDLTGGSLPLPARDVARFLNRAIGLLR